MPIIQVLGAYGSKGVSKNTSCIKISDDSVIDAGNVIGGLGDNASKIDNIFVTHCHFDHLLDIPFLLDMYFASRDKPYKIFALPKTIEAIKQHMLNDYIWPDFSKIKLLKSDNKGIEYVPLEIGQKYSFDDFEIKPVELNHSVECCGFVVTKNGNSIMVGADTYLCDFIADEVNNNKSITSVLIECSFPNAMPKLAEASQHLTPELTSIMVAKFDRKLKLFINHLKPAYAEKILQEISQTENLADAVVMDDMMEIAF